MPLPSPFKEITEADKVTAVWNNRVHNVTLNELVVTGTRGKSYTLDRLFRLHDPISGKVIWITGDAYDKWERRRNEAIAKAKAK